MQTIKMNFVEIIEKKKNKEVLSKEEIDYFIKNYVNGKIKDYQVASLLMAIRLNGMNIKETIDLTNSIVNSGITINYEDVDRIIVDKHSTGGVGDKVTLVLIPLFASLGFGVSKMSGRGLGFTGGTLDKLESIEGFNISLNNEKIKKAVQDIGCVIVGQNEKIVPADRKLYALRDVTATVDSLPLIASSIMSKKLAMGAQVIVLDVKYGKGGFMKTYDDALELAKLMREIGQKMNKKVICFITSMEQPLGKNIGNALEVKEAIEVLKGENLGEVRKLCELMAVEVVSEINKVSKEEAKMQVIEAFDSKRTFEKFKQLLENQGVEEKNINPIISSKKYEFKSKKSGYVSSIKTDKVGISSMELGAGRRTKEEEIDHTVGLEVIKKIGDYVEIGDVLVTMYYSSEEKLEEAKEVISECFTIGDNQTDPPKLIKNIIN